MGTRRRPNLAVALFCLFVLGCASSMTAPCGVDHQPEIVIVGSEEDRAEAERTDPNFSVFRGKQTNEEIIDNARQAALRGLATVRRANTSFLCGLERIEFLPDANYAEHVETKSFAHYDSAERVVRVRLYGAVYPVVHEIAHHVDLHGLATSTVEAFLEQTWRWNGDERSTTCAGARCFIYGKAAVSPAEDWARTLEETLLNPTDTLLHVSAFNLDAVGATPLQRKLQLILDIVQGDKPRRGTAAVGPAQTLPHSSWQVLSEGALFLVDEPRRTIARYELRGSRFEPQAAADAQLLLEILDDEHGHDAAEVVWSSAHTAGGVVAWVGRVGELEPGIDRQRQSSVFAIGAAGELASRFLLPAHPPVIGGLAGYNGAIGYFRYANRELQLASRSGSEADATQLRAWPVRDVPMYVVSLGDRGLAALAHEREPPYWNPRVFLLRTGEDGAFERKDSIVLDRDFWKHARAPLSTGRFLVFPSAIDSQTLRVLLYDIERDRFTIPMLVTSALPDAFRAAGGSWERVELFASRGRLFVAAVVRGGATLIAPVRISVD